MVHVLTSVVGLQIVAGLLAAPYFVTRGVLPYVGLSADTLHVRSHTCRTAQCRCFLQTA